MSAENHAPHEPSTTAEVPPVAGTPEATATTGLTRVVRAIQRNPLMRPFVVRDEFRQEVIKANVKLMTENPTGSPDVVQNFVNTHRTKKKVHTDTPKAEEPAGQTLYRSGAERYEALHYSRARHHLIELRNQKAILQQAYPGIDLGSDKKSFEAAISGMPWRGRAAARKARRDYLDRTHHEHELYGKFGLKPHAVEEARNKTPELTDEQKAAKKEAESINKLAELKGDIDTIKRKIHDKTRFINDYAGDLGQKIRIGHETSDREKLLKDMRKTREDLNKRLYTHLRDHDPDAVPQSDGSILIEGANINNIPGTWAVYEDGRAIQLADDGSVLAMYRPNGVRYHVNHDRMKQKLEEDILAQPGGPEFLKKNFTDTGRDVVDVSTDFESRLQNVDIAEKDKLQNETESLQAVIQQKRRNGEDITDDLHKLRNLNQRRNMALYDYLYNAPKEADRPREGVVVMREPDTVGGVWGEWAIFEDGSSICRDQDGEVIARFTADGTPRSMRTDPYATIDTQPLRKPSGDTLDQMNTEISTRKRLIDDSRKFIEKNQGNPGLEDEVKKQRNFITTTLESIRTVREEYNITLYNQLQTSPPADALFGSNGAIIAKTTMNGYEGTWMIHKDKSAAYFGQKTAVADAINARPLAYFHRNGFRYE